MGIRSRIKTWYRKQLVKQTRSELNFVISIVTPAIENFVVRDRLIVGETDGVKIGYIDETFLRVFGNKVEQNIEKATLRVYKHTISLRCDLVLEALGEKKQAEISVSVAQMFSFFKTVGHLEEPTWYSFYIYDDFGNLWRVVCFYDMYDDNWIIMSPDKADSVTDWCNWVVVS